MTRIGPNQDINDPTILEELRATAELAAVLANDHNNADDGITEIKSISPKIHPDNTRIIPITTLLKKVDGSETEITGFTTSGTYKQENIDLYMESVINTYIDQAERFRNYYDQLTSIMNFWSNRDNGSPFANPFITTQTVDIDFVDIHRGWAESNISIRQKDGYATINQSEIIASIDWIGNGPTNYNSGTYPQLSSAFDNLITLMSESSRPYFDVTDVLSQGYYAGADKNDGFLTTIDLFERVDWNNISQKFAQTSKILIFQNDLNYPILIGSDHFFRIPIIVSNFTDSRQNIGYVAKITMTPRNSDNRIFQDFHPGFVNKRIHLIGHHTSELDEDYIQHDGDNTSEVNDMLTSDFSLQINDFISVPKRSLAISTVQVAFINQLYIANGIFADWDTEDLLSDINVQFSVDGHFINKDFDPGIERNMWNNPPPP